MKDLKKTISELFKKFGYRLVLNPADGKIEIQKDLEDIIVSVPYALSSETLQRMAFYLAAIHSNKEAILGFEEPEAHAFPYYTKYLAERIALDNANNQYFIATHNPYFLTSIMEKTPKNEIATFVTYFEDYQTKVKALSGKEIEHALAMGSDVFFNIDQFLEKDSDKGN
jgi:AAA15 family ATPase/GTPase